MQREELVLGWRGKETEVSEGNCCFRNMPYRLSLQTFTTLLHTLCSGTMSASNSGPHPGEPDAQRRRTEDPPPAWVAQLLSLPNEIRELRERLDAMSISSQHQRPRVTFPTIVTAQALADLAADPQTPPVAAPFLVALGTVFPVLLDDSHIAAVQQAYDHALRLREPPNPSTPRPRSSSQSRSPQRFVTDASGRTFYVTNSGKYYDISLPPPKPCRVCGVYHWSWNCPRQGDRYPPSAPAFYPPSAPVFYPNSPSGGGPAAQRPSQ